MAPHGQSSYIGPQSPPLTFDILISYCSSPCSFCCNHALPLLTLDLAHTVAPYFPETHMACFLPPTLTSQLAPAYHNSLPFPNCPQPLVLLSKTRLPGATQGWGTEMEPEGAQEDLFRVSRAWAASSFCCHSEEAETEAWLEASGA